MNRTYEAVFILSPTLSEKQVTETAKDYKQLIEKMGGVITNKENWGLKKLAYPILKKKTGFYHLFQFDLDPESVLSLDLQFRRDEQVIRHLLVKLDAHAIEWAKKRVEAQNVKN